jgi:hypothetical protein
VLAWKDGAYGVSARSTLALCLWWALAVALAVRLWPVARLGRTAAWGIALWLALALWTLLSAWWAPSAEQAFLEFDRVALYLGIFTIACVSATRTTRRAWCDGTAAAIAAIGICALASRFFPDLFSSRGLTAFLPDARARLSFPLGYWNGLAAFLALGVPLLVSAAVSARSPLRAAPATAALPVLATGIYLASSRGAVAAAAAGALVLVAATDRRWESIGALVSGAAGSSVAIAAVSTREAVVDGLDTGTAVSQGRQAAVFVVLGALVAGGLYAFARPHLGFRLPLRAARLAVAGLVVLALVAVALSHPGRRFESFKRTPAQVSFEQGSFVGEHLLSGAGSGRWQFWSSAVDEWQEDPVEGGGAGSYGSWWSAHGSFAYTLRDAHSLYVEMLAELGLVGFALLMGALVLPLVAGIRTLRRVVGERSTCAALLAVAAVWLVAAGVDWLWELPAVTVVGVAALGLLVGMFRAPAPRAGPVTAARWLGVGAALVLAAAQALPLLTEYRLDASRDAARAGDLAGARERADAAAALEPWASSPRLQLALVDEQLGRLARARGEIDEAIRRDTGDWRLRFIAARIERGLGNAAEARRRLAEARALNPRSTLVGGSG